LGKRKLVSGGGKKKASEDLQKGKNGYSVCEETSTPRTLEAVVPKQLAPTGLRGYLNLLRPATQEFKAPPEKIH